MALDSISSAQSRIPALCPLPLSIRQVDPCYRIAPLPQIVQARARGPPGMSLRLLLPHAWLVTSTSVQRCSILRAFSAPQ
jgi:hypothetical protein